MSFVTNVNKSHHYGTVSQSTGSQDKNNEVDNPVMLAIIYLISHSYY